MTSICPYKDWGPTPAVSNTGYWQLVTYTCEMNRYERDIFTDVFVPICGGDTDRYRQIQTDTNTFKEPKKIFS